MNVDQKQLKDEFVISNNRFLNMIANGVSELITKNVPGLKLHYTGKSIKNNNISAILTGEIYCPNQEEYNNTSDKVKSVMQRLKNPTNLIETIK